MGIRGMKVEKKRVRKMVSMVLYAIVAISGAISGLAWLWTIYK